jgi:protein gp37
MAKDSKIEWTDATFNPWIGCTKVSAGCKNCYAERDMTRKPRWADTWGEDGVRLRTSDEYWKKPLKWNKQGKLRVFCGSLCDIFDDHPSIEDHWRSDLWDLIERTPNLTWMLLTKRPENLKKYAFEAGIDLDNIWWGISAENQETLDERLPNFIPYTYQPRFISHEPLLGEIDLSLAIAPYSPPIKWKHGDQKYHPVSWVIVGGESGQNARPMHPDWARKIRDQCIKHEVPFFFKQWGEWCPQEQVTAPWVNPEVTMIFENNYYYPMARLGRKKAGRVLDDKTWDETPDF